MKQLWWDLDGTLVNLYGVDAWLSKLQAEDVSPYVIAAPLVNLSRLAYYINRLQKAGYFIGVISWLSKSSTPEYDKAVTAAKLQWLKEHLPSVNWNAIKIVPYGTNKWNCCGGGVLFDDEERNRKSWLNGDAYAPSQIFNILQELNKAA